MFCKNKERNRYGGDRSIELRIGAAESVYGFVREKRHNEELRVGNNAISEGCGVENRGEEIPHSKDVHEVISG